MTAWHLTVDPTRCVGNLSCAELLPEHVTVDDWGFPIIDGRPIHGRSLRHAHAAVKACPVLALRLQRSTERS